MLNALYKPEVVAVIGASKNPLSIGHRVLANLRDYHFNGSIYPVNPKEKSVGGFRAYKSVLDIPDQVDLVNISIPARFIPAAIEECGQKGVKFAIVHSAGFCEVGDKGRELQCQMLDIAKKYGVRIYGPNSQGVMNSDPQVSLYANFTFTPLKPGNISIIAQSGGVGEQINLELERAGVGIRMYASNGNASDVSIEELLDYFGHDEKTKVILLYLESFQNPSKLVEIAAQITPQKPILAIKAGTSIEGARAICSHTGAMMKQDAITDVLFERAGVIRFLRQEDLVDAAIAFSQQPLPRGNKLAIVTNAGGPAIQATDEAIARGMELAELSDNTRQNLGVEVSQMSSLKNPVDITATAGSKEFSHTLKTLLADSQVHSLLLSMVTPFFVDNESVVAEIIEALRGSKIPTVASVLTNRDKWGHIIQILRNAAIPVYDYSETAAGALAAMSYYAKIRTIERGKLENFPCDRQRAQNILTSTHKDEHGFIPLMDAFEIAKCYQIPCVKTEVFSLEQLAEASLVYPVALKADIAGVVHKTEAGAVALAILNKQQLLEKARQMQEKFASGVRFCVQPMESVKREMIAGMSKVGNIAAIAIGAGGIFSEIIEDVQFRLVPITRKDASSMLQSLKSYPLLTGARSQPAVDLSSIEEILLRLSQLTIDFPQIREIDFNPLLVFEDGNKNMIVDVRMRLEGKNG